MKKELEYIKYNGLPCITVWTISSVQILFERHSLYHKPWDGPGSCTRTGLVCAL